MSFRNFAPHGLGTSGAEGITAGPDGNMWFAERYANRIGRITPSGVINEFLVPTPDAGLSYIVKGPDGNLWFTEFNASQVAKISP